MTRTSPRLPLSIIALLLLLVVGLAPGGLYGAVAFITDPSGASLGVSTALLARLPFVKDFLLPGFFLLGVMTIAPVVIAVGLWRRRAWGWPAALALSAVLIAWLLFEIWMFGLTAPIQFVTGALGFVLLGLCLLPSVRAFSRVDAAPKTAGLA